MKEKNLLKLVLIHVGIGISLAFFPVLAKIYAVLIIGAGIFWVIKKRNQNQEVLFVIAYITGSEVFLRTTGGSFCYEYGKYFLLLFTALGIFYSGIPVKRNVYFLFLLLIIPSVFVPFEGFHDIKQKIAFDILGPVCLGILALYTYKRKISKTLLHDILGMLLLPTIACCVFLSLRFPYFDGIVNNTESNVYLSGDFAPNQMATTLGLAIFLYFIRILLIPTSRKLLIISLCIFCLIYYRGLMTFSRGGMITGLALIVVFSLSLWISRKGYPNIRRRLALVLVILPAVFILASHQTNTLLYKRYANQNINGLKKRSEVNGRQDMALEEIKLFKDHPVLGIGVGSTKQIRKAEDGSTKLTHSEVTRLLAEHGILGILSLMILISTPLLIYLKNRKNIYLLSFFAFWFLTINHSGMRIAAPAFIYALALLDIQFDKNNEEA